MFRFLLLVITTSAIAFGCGGNRQQDIQTALDAVKSAHQAASEELGDEPVAAGALTLLSVALDSYQQAASNDDGSDRAWTWYVNWIRLAARAVCAVVDILDGAGVHVPDAIMQASAALQRWLN